MRPCLVCGRPGDGPRCTPHQRDWERMRQERFPQRRTYGEPAYRAMRLALLHGNPECYLCGQPGADTLDHLRPLAQGGTNDPSNLRPAHRACNTRKGTDMARTQNWPPTAEQPGPVEEEAPEGDESAAEADPAPDTEEAEEEPETAN